MYDEIIEQLKDYCDCLPDMDDLLLEKNIIEMINLISVMTCWTQVPCETFLMSERTEMIDVKPFDPCDCDGGLFEFVPFYEPVDSMSFQVFLIETQGVNETVTELSEDSFNYSETFGKLRIDLNGYVMSDNCCCPPDYKLLIRYYAGYELLPDCLLPLFCDLLHVLYEKNRCDCSACQVCDKGTDVIVEYDDEVSENLGKYLDRLIEWGFKRQLGLISLCHKYNDGWCVVV